MVWTMEKNSTADKCSKLKLIKYFLSFKERDLNRRKERQKELDKMNYLQLSAEFSRDLERYYRNKKIYNLSSSVGFISLISYIITEFTKISAKYYAVNQVSKKVQLSVVLISFLILIILVVLLFTVAFTISDLAKKKASLRMIKEALNMKKSSHEEYLRKQEEKKKEEVNFTRGKQ